MTNWLSQTQKMSSQSQTAAKNTQEKYSQYFKTIFLNTKEVHCVKLSFAMRQRQLFLRSNRGMITVFITEAQTLGSEGRMITQTRPFKPTAISKDKFLPNTSKTGGVGLFSNLPTLKTNHHKSQFLIFLKGDACKAQYHTAVISTRKLTDRDEISRLWCKTFHQPKWADNIN
jgi:hypothetical protein